MRITGSAGMPARDDDRRFDMPSLVARCLGDERFAREMLRLFAQQAPEMLNRLDTALATGGPVEIAAAAHALKGSASNVSAVRAAAVARAFEESARAGQAPAVADLQSLRQELAYCIAYVESLDGS
jgi:HPt (histidine-containing phosphotransfer) domain-containing protein